MSVACLGPTPGTAPQRHRALEQFGLDETEFHDRHEMLVSSFERGKIGLDEYLDRTVFYRPRSFTRQAFRDYMCSLSRPDPASLGLARELAKSGKYLMSTINNESRDLNQYRIEAFGLREIFTRLRKLVLRGVAKTGRRNLPPGHGTHAEGAGGKLFCG